MRQKYMTHAVSYKKNKFSLFIFDSYSQLKFTSKSFS